MRALLSLMICLGLSCTHTKPKADTLNLSAAPKGKTFTDWGEYIIDSGDLVNVLVEDLKGMNGPQKVSPSGYISLPTIGMVRAKGLTEMQLREAVILKLRPHTKVPRVAITVTQMNSYVVTFDGHIMRPGPYKLEARTTLQQGLALAGGLRSDAASTLIVVRDTPEGIRRRYEMPLKGLKESLAVLDNFMLERGDLIIIE